MLGKATVFAAGVAAGALVACALPAPSQERSRPAVSRVDMKRITDAMDVIRANFAGALDNRLLADGCIAGLMARQDRMYAYYDRAEFAELQHGSTAIGVGLELRYDGARIKVVAPIEGAPADQAGVRAGDVIAGIDDQDTSRMTLPEVVKALRGAEGSTVRLTLTRARVADPIVLSVTRQTIRPPESVRARLLGDGIGYLRIVQFRVDTPELFIQALARLRSENGGALKGLVLDLRSNSGGLLGGSVAIAAAFLAEDAVIAKSEGYAEDSRTTFTGNLQQIRRGAPPDWRARLPAELRSMPLAVLVDRGTASGSEIVAGALQDHQRAALIGEKTFGAGSLQTIFPLGESGIKVTTAYWRTPNGRAIEERGITPDHAAEGEAALARAVEILRTK